MVPVQNGKRRSETISVRLDPKLRYLSDLAARKQRRTISSFVEWAIEASLDKVIIHEGDQFEQKPSITLGSVASSLWDVDPADRFVKLALRYPELLTHEEQLLWKVLRRHGYFWDAKWDPSMSVFRWRTDEVSLRKDKLRRYWEMLNQVARGELDKTSLPQLTVPPAMPVLEIEPPDPEDDLDNAPMDDEDIPF
jgi:hypothetical protein